MSTTVQAAPRVEPAPASIRRPDVGALLRRIELRDWVTLGILVWMLGSVAWSVQLSRWGDLPSIIPTVMLGLITGFVLTRSRLPWPVKLVAPFAVGFLVVFWQGSIPADGGDPAFRARDAWERFFDWVRDAREGGINRDSVPFALMFMTASWIVGYLTAWITFRWRNPWAPTILLGLAILTNLSYRQGQFEYTFLLFILGGMALFAHVTTVQRISRWEADGTEYLGSIRWIGARNAAVVGAVALLIAGLTPLFEPRSGVLKESWDLLKTPVQFLRDPASRLLAGVKGRGEGMLAAPERVLPFRGPLNLTEEPIMWVNSKYASLHPARVYDLYTPQGWLTSEHNVFTATPGVPMSNPPVELSRERVEQTIHPLFPSRTVLGVGSLFSLSRETHVDILTPRRYTISLEDASLDTSLMPQDIGRMGRDLLSRLAEMEEQGGEEGDLGAEPRFSVEEVERELSPLTPEDVTTRVLEDADAGFATYVIAERITPPEQTGVRMAEEGVENQAYSLVVFQSRASEEELALSGSDYPNWVTDRYLRLPVSLPDRIGELSRSIVSRANAVTPFEKVQAIKDFLQSQSYSLEIQGPEVGQGGVDWFLFESLNEPCPDAADNCRPSEIKGYSQYFGSAATVMLRYAGVPSRMVAGWAPGVYVPQARQFLLLDRDRHGWTQVYFKNYGWVDVEVTPGRADPPKDFEVPELPAGFDALDDEGLLDLDSEFLEEIDPDLLAELGLLENVPVGGLQGDGSGPPTALYAALVVVAGMALLAFATWKWIHRGMDPESRAYARMVHFGRLIGMRRPAHHTPSEYSRHLGFVVPPIADSASLIASSYERWQYGRRKIGADEENELERAWVRLLRGLLAYRIGLTGRRREGSAAEEMPSATSRVGALPSDAAPS